MNNHKQIHNARFGLLRRNKFLLFWCRFFIELNALQAIVQLFYLHRGVSLSQIFYLGIAWSLATIIFDIPTSILADRWGRKKTIILGVLMNIIANFLMFFSYGFIPFFLNTFILSISFSFFAGVEDAFIFDTLKEMKQEGIVLKTSGKYAIASRLSKILTPFLGVLIAGGLLASQFNILLTFNLISSCVALIFTFLLVEPKKQKTEYVSKIKFLKDSFSLLKDSKVLRTMAINKTLLFIASFIFWKFYQQSLLNMGITVFMLGILYPIFNTITILLYAKAQCIFNKFDKGLIFEFPVWLTLVGSLIFALSPYKWVAYFLSVILIISGNMRDPFFNQQIQWRLQSHNRATAGSALSILKSVLDIPTLLLSGYLASLSPNAIMIVPVFLSLISLLFFRIKKQDILLEPLRKQS